MAQASDHSPTANTRLKRSAARLAVASDVVLLVSKAVTAVVTGSVGVLAEVVNSAGDLVGALIVYLAVRVADEPPDDSHKYGHGKIENLSGAATAGLVIAGGIYAGLEAVQHIVHPVALPHLRAGVVVMAVSAIANAFVSSYLLRVGRATDSPALIADGTHLRTDVVTSSAVLLGLFSVRLGAPPFWDAVAGLAVSIAIISIGLRLARSAVDSLSDRALPADEEQILRDVLTNHPDVMSFHRLRTRRSGSERHADVHVQVNDSMSFVAAHELAEQLEDELRASLPNLDPVIHMEPHDEEMAHQSRDHPGWTADESHAGGGREKTSPGP